MHGNTKLEVVKCWRLHLGASNLTGMVINSVADEKTLASRCEVLEQKNLRESTYNSPRQPATLCETCSEEVDGGFSAKSLVASKIKKITCSTKSSPFSGRALSPLWRWDLEKIEISEVICCP